MGSETSIQWNRQVKCNTVLLLNADRVFTYFKMDFLFQFIQRDLLVEVNGPFAHFTKGNNGFSASL